MVVVVVVLGGVMEVERATQRNGNAPRLRVGVDVGGLGAHFDGSGPANPGKLVMGP